MGRGGFKLLINMNSDYLNRRLQETKIKNLQSSNKSGSMPSYVQMARNAGSSLLRNSISVVQGNDLRLSKEEAERRQNICNSCPFFEKSSSRCGKCGCYLAVKTYLKAEHCPVGKW